MGAAQSQAFKDKEEFASRYGGKVSSPVMQQTRQADAQSAAAQEAHLQNSLPTPSQYSSQLNRGGLAHVDSDEVSAAGEEKMPLVRPSDS